MIILHLQSSFFKFKINFLYYTIYTFQTDTINIFLSGSLVDTKVEIQIRTIAMDFWASLEHKIYYKFEGHAPEYISRDLRACAEIVSNLDAKMLQLNEAILEEKEKEEQKKKEG